MYLLYITYVTIKDDIVILVMKESMPSLND